MILNSEQLPHINNRAFGAGGSWLDYENTSPRGGADASTISPRSHKSKDRTPLAKSMTPVSTNTFLDSTDHPIYPPGSLYHNPNSVEDHHQQRLDRFQVTNDGMCSNRGSSQVFGQHSASGNVFLSQHLQYENPSEFSSSIGGSGGVNNTLASSPIWYQSVSREGLVGTEELSPYDLSPRQSIAHWPSFPQNQCTDPPLASTGMYQGVEGVTDDSSLEIAQRVLQYPISNEGSQQHCSAQDGRSHENGVDNEINRHDLYFPDHRVQQMHSQQASNHLHTISNSSSWKDVESQLMSNNKCISIPGGGILQALHPMQPEQRSVSRTSIYSNNSSTSDQGSPSMAVLSNVDPTNPSIPIQVDVSGGVAGGVTTHGIVSIEGSNNDYSSMESISSPGIDRALDSIQPHTRNLGRGGNQGRLVHPSLAHNMDELEIVSTISSESTLLSTEPNNSPTLSQNHISNLRESGKSSGNINRKTSTD